MPCFVMFIPNTKHQNMIILFLTKLQPESNTVRMSGTVIREITPLTPNDCFTIFSRAKKEFDFPLHSHEEMELNLILNAAGHKGS